MTHKSPITRGSPAKAAASCHVPPAPERIPLRVATVAFLLDITTARLFVAVAEEAGIARAARRERIAASPISKRLAAC